MDKDRIDGDGKEAGNYPSWRVDPLSLIVVLLIVIGATGILDKALLVVACGMGKPKYNFSIWK